MFSFIVKTKFKIVVETPFLLSNCVLNARLEGRSTCAWAGLGHQLSWSYSGSRFLFSARGICCQLLVIDGTIYKRPSTYLLVVQLKIGGINVVNFCGGYYSGVKRFNV